MANELAILRHQGATVLRPASSVDGARRLVLGLEPDCVLLDVNLRGESGFPLAEELLHRGFHFAPCSPPKSALNQLLDRLPHLTPPLWWSTLIEDSVTRERVVNAGSSARLRCWRRRARHSSGPACVCTHRSPVESAVLSARPDAARIPTRAAETGLQGDNQGPAIFDPRVSCPSFPPTDRTCSEHP